MNVYICPICAETVHENFLHGFRWIEVAQFETRGDAETRIFLCAEDCASIWLKMDHKEKGKQLEKVAKVIKGLKVQLTFEEIKE